MNKEKELLHEVLEAINSVQNMKWSVMNVGVGVDKFHAGWISACNHIRNEILALPIGEENGEDS